jgi:hypothetical protein
VIAAIMPCRGRPEQTARNVKRLLATAGRVEWQLWCVAGGEDAMPLKGMLDDLLPAPHNCLWHPKPFTYWQALEVATQATDAPLLCNLANDLLPGRDWLARCLSAYRARFGDGDGLMGFNDGIHGPLLSPHFLISRGLLARYGGWPVWYQHTMGDAELCERAKADGCYGKAPWAVLYHDHPLVGASHDAVYAAGETSIDADYALFERRMARGWSD